MSKEKYKIEQLEEQDLKCRVCPISKVCKAKRCQLENRIPKCTWNPDDGNYPKERKAFLDLNTERLVLALKVWRMINDINHERILASLENTRFILENLVTPKSMYYKIRQRRIFYEQSIIYERNFPDESRYKGVNQIAGDETEAFLYSHRS